MWCPDCGTEMHLPQNSCPSCHKQIPLGSGEFLPPLPVPETTPLSDAPPAQPDPPLPPESGAPDPGNSDDSNDSPFIQWTQQCKADLLGLWNRFKRKDDDPS